MASAEVSFQKRQHEIYNFKEIVVFAEKPWQIFTTVTKRLIFTKPRTQAFNSYHHFHGAQFSAYFLDSVNKPIG